MRNEHLSAAQILKLRDKAFVDYHTYQPFLNRIKKRFGQGAVDNVKDSLKIILKRKILGD